MRFRTLLFLALTSRGGRLAAAASTAVAEAGAPSCPGSTTTTPAPSPEAKRKKIPIFVEALGALVPHVPLDAGLRLHGQGPREARRAVRLALDRHGKDAERALRQEVPDPGLAVLLRDRSGHGDVALRWVGGATVAQLRKFFDDGVACGAEATADARRSRKADALYGRGRLREGARSRTRRRWRRCPEGSRAYSRAVESLLFSLQTTRNHAECVALARATLPSLRGTRSPAATLAGAGLDCAAASCRPTRRGPLRGDRLLRGEGPRGARRCFAQARGRRPVRALRLPAVRARRRRGQGRRAEGRGRVGRVPRRARRRARRRPTQRTALDPNRLNAFEAAGQIEKAIPMLEQLREGLSRGLQPAGAAGPGLPEAQAVRRRRSRPPTARSRWCTGPASCACSRSARTSIRGWATRPRRGRRVEDALAYAEALPPGQRSEPHDRGAQEAAREARR